MPISTWDCERRRGFTLPAISDDFYKRPGWLIGQLLDETQSANDKSLKSLALPSGAVESNVLNDLAQGLGSGPVIGKQCRSEDSPKQIRADEVIEIVVAPRDRRGRFNASLRDGTSVVRSSRQPLLDAARVLIQQGYSPNARIEMWRPGAAQCAMHAVLGLAARLTVDETRTVFAPWKPFSSSAVASQTRSGAGAATTETHWPLK
jgi:hypothetical protein